MPPMDSSPVRRPARNRDEVISLFVQYELVVAGEAESVFLSLVLDDQFVRGAEQIFTAKTRKGRRTLRRAGGAERGTGGMHGHLAATEKYGPWNDNHSH